MYAPAQFREERREVLVAALQSIGLAALVTYAPEGAPPAGAPLDGPPPDGDRTRYAASHVPMIAREDGGALVLEAHVSRSNPHWRLATGAAAAASLAIFQGPHAYVHPGWYATKRSDGRVVPTWNYIAVHAHGVLTAVEEPAWLWRHLAELTAAHEAGRPEPWALGDAPPDYLERQLRGIVGLRLAVGRLEGVWKMIQHHPAANRQGVIAGLGASAAPNDRAVAGVMAALEAARPGPHGG